MNDQNNLVQLLLSLHLTETTINKRAKFKIKPKFSVFKLKLKQITAYFDLDPSLIKGHAFFVSLTVPLLLIKINYSSYYKRSTFLNVVKCLVIIKKNGFCLVILKKKISMKL